MARILELVSMPDGRVGVVLDVPPDAGGSGGDYAIGAMDYGASPQEAVAIAIRRSVNCGGEVQVVNIAEALGQLRQAAE